MNNNISAKSGSAFVGNFSKDLLLIDTEFSGFDLKKHELLQIAAVLLDKRTLKEKKHFNSFIKSTKWKYRDPNAMAVNKITLDKVKNAPTLKQVIKKFDSCFKKTEVLLTSYVGFADKKFLLDAYTKTHTDFKFDYHYYDIWSAAYTYFAKTNNLKSKKDFAGFGMEYMMSVLNIKSEVTHDALADCRIEAEILRKIMGKILK